MRLLERKTRWGLTWQGYVAMLGVMAALGWVGMLNVYSFLAVTRPIDARLLVVEGWVHTNVIQAAAAEFKAGGYDRVFSTGGPVQGTGGYTNDYNTSAAVGAARLKAAGIPPELVSMAPARGTERDRTYASAVALRDLLAQRAISFSRLNIITADAHARRTRLLFEKAFGSAVQIGIIAIPNPDYDARHWWRYSEGVRDVLGEGISYLYARLLFFPPAVPTSNLAAAGTQPSSH